MVYEEDGIVYEDELVDIVKLMSTRKMWKPKPEEVGWEQSYAERKAKFEEWHVLMNRFFNKNVELRFEGITEQSDKTPGASGMSGFVPADQPEMPSVDGIIFFVGRFSVLTFLHCWAVAIGCADIQKWAMGLFKIGFPNSHKNLVNHHGLLINQREQPDPALDNSDDFPPLE